MTIAEHNRPIRFGLFDSGVGGLSVFKHLHQLASLSPERQFEFIYVGDTARCPYGNRSAAEIKDYVGQIIAFLYNRGVDHVVMACNTSAAIGLEYAREISPVPVHDIISPAARHVASNYKRIGVMATQPTAKSRAFARAIAQHAPEAEIVEIGCPNLVPLVESGDINSDKTKAVLSEYTGIMMELEVNAIILGCTHFPFLRKAIRELVPSTVALIDPAEWLTRQIAADLGIEPVLDLPQEIVREIHCHHTSTFFTTGSASAFAHTAAVCLGKRGAALVPAENIFGLPLEVVENSAITADMPAALPSSNVVLLPSLKNQTDSKSVAP